MEWLAALEQNGISTWVRESGSIWAYPTILTLHTLGLGVVVGANAALDLRLLGFGRRIPLADFGGLFKGMWWGFALNALTGVLLFASDATTKGIQQIFYVKLVCIALAVVTMVRLKSAVYGVGPDRATITPRTTRLAVASLIFWAAAITAGRLMAYL